MSNGPVPLPILRLDVSAIARSGSSRVAPMNDGACLGCARCTLKRGTDRARDPKAMPQASTSAATPNVSWPSMAPEAFLASGGIVSADELAMQLREQFEQPISRVARWIVSGQIVSFTFASQTMVPLFQFETTPLRPRPALRKIIAELNDVLDEGEVVEWFALFNGALSGARPADCMSDPDLVYQAARVDRYVMRGC
jgi:hypothetical protein